MTGQPDADQPEVADPGFSQLAGRPRLRGAEAAELLVAWGLRVAVPDLHELESERDQNWLVRTGGRARYVLKVANQADDRDVLAFQQAMMRRLTGHGLPCPSVVATTTGASWLATGGHLVWLLEHLPGIRLADAGRRTPALLWSLGRLLARATVALTGFDHPAAHRPLQWDVQQSRAVIDTYRSAVTDPANRAVLDRSARDVERRVEPLLARLDRSVIHNDANDHNILVEGDTITGLLDFGDAVHTVTVNDLAVACAYAMLGQPDPYAVMRALTDGYTHTRQLSELERSALPHLVRARLATSVAISAYQQTVQPDNDYLRVSERPAWLLLARLQEDS